MSLVTSIPPPKIKGTLEYEHFVHPFRPSSKHSNLCSRNIFDKPIISSNNNNNNNNNLDKLNDDIYYDAETNKPIKLTKSLWNGREGRLNIDAKSIIGMGTGILDINNNNNNNNNKNIFNKKNDLIEQFLQKGPLTPVYHKYWDPKTGEVNETKFLKLQKNNNNDENKNKNNNNNNNNSSSSSSSSSDEDSDSNSDSDSDNDDISIYIDNSNINKPNIIKNNENNENNENNDLDHNELNDVFPTNIQIENNSIKPPIVLYSNTTNNNSIIDKKYIDLNQQTSPDGKLALMTVTLAAQKLDEIELSKSRTDMLNIGKIPEIKLNNNNDININININNNINRKNSNSINISPIRKSSFDSSNSTLDTVDTSIKSNINLISTSTRRKSSLSKVSTLVNATSRRKSSVSNFSISSNNLNSNSNNNKITHGRRTGAIELITHAHEMYQLLGVDENQTHDEDEDLIAYELQLPSNVLENRNFISETLANPKTWKTMEKQIYNELYTILTDMENNKSKTGEKRHSLVNLDFICKDLARMKRRSNQQITVAVVLEKQKEAQRELAEKRMDDPVQLKEMVRIHNDQRQKFRTYISTVQYDNELLFIKKMKQEEILW